MMTVLMMAVSTMPVLLMPLKSFIVFLVSYSLFITKAKKGLITNPLFKVPDEYQNEIVGIESFFVCLTKRYNISPKFFSGSLQDACQTAFNSTIIEEVRSRFFNNYIRHKGLFRFSIVQYLSIYIMIRACSAMYSVRKLSSTI